MQEFIDKLIARLEEKRNEKYINGVSKFPSREQKVFDIAETIVNQLAEEHNNGWIPCSETLPKEEGIYWVTRANGEVDKEAFQIWANGGSFRSDFQLPDEKVIAWMPLPAQYQPKGE